MSINKMNQCLFIKKDGKQCKKSGSKKSQQNNSYCHLHQPSSVLQLIKPTYDGDKEDNKHFTISVYAMGSNFDGESINIDYYANIKNITSGEFQDKYDLGLFQETFGQKLRDAGLIDEIDESFSYPKEVSPLIDSEVSIIYDHATKETKYNPEKLTLYEIQD